MDKLNLQKISEFETWLFDLDGTLIDSKNSNYLAYRDSLSQINLNLVYEDFTMYWGQDAEHFLPKIFPNISKEQILNIKELKPTLLQNHLTEIKVNYGLLGLIEENFKHHKIGLVTTAKSASLSAIFNFLKIDKYFSVIVTGDSPVAPKPSPEPYLFALAMLKSEAKNAIAFEDSETGILSASNAGIKVVKIDFNSV